MVEQFEEKHYFLISHICPSYNGVSLNFTSDNDWQTFELYKYKVSYPPVLWFANSSSFK